MSNTNNKTNKTNSKTNKTNSKTNKTNSKTNKTNSKTRVTPKLKRPLNAFMLYSQANRDVLKKQGLKSTEISKKLSEQWNNMSSVEKKMYEDQAHVAREEYNEKTGKNKKDEKKKNTPKRPLNAYMIFIKKQRISISEESGLHGKELNKKMGELWNKMSEKDKAPYEEQAKQQRIKYHATKEEIKKSKSINSISSEKTTKSKDSVKSKDSKESKEQKRISKSKKDKKIFESSGSRLCVMKDRKAECVIDSKWQ